jgi:protein required for attachment to host cells
MSRQPRLGYLVADGARARLILRHSTGTYETLQAFESDSKAHTPHRDGRTRVFASSGTSRSAVEGSSERLKIQERFASELGEALNQAAAKDLFDGLVLAAPAKMLHAIRDGLDVMARGKLRGESMKDLTKLPEAELQKRLEHLSLTGSMGPSSS